MARLFALDPSPKFASRRSLTLTTCANCRPSLKGRVESSRAASAFTSAAASFISAMQARTIARISFISRVRNPWVTRLRLPSGAPRLAIRRCECAGR